ncbi:uncharacterized protein LOC143908926 [Arctopsyche grandis]|uniref:uncharacterized protein LOC143908926 n=1 Tax=Arctopsyche grandis TaxID=121162 RepID=UPI00406D8522
MLRGVLSLLRGSGYDAMAGCLADCSGRGECWNGTCYCEIQYSGDACNGPNLPYHRGIGGVFLGVALVCGMQLLACVAADYRRQKRPKILRACRVTTQKLLYLVVFFAALIRAAYFSAPYKETWSSTLLSAYYPLLMSGASLIVCFWAEIFHLRDIRWERPQFLSKSFLGFVTFNIIIYSLLAAEVVTTQFADTTTEKKSFYTHVFNGCYAVFLFIVVVFFLIYGVEVFFKVRGGFLTETTVTTIVTQRNSNRRQGKSTKDKADEKGEDLEQLAKPCCSKDFLDDEVKPGDGAEAHDQLVTKQGVRVFAGATGVNTSQLHQSRVGLLSQAFMLITIVGFLFSETLSEFWKTKVPVNSRNWHDVVFRVVEIGVALWFPCVLWNCMAPEQLWILNPRRLLSQQQPENEAAAPQTTTDKDDEEDIGGSCSSLGARDCWICYDSERAEPLIQPCKCTGDVSSVHHDCLRRWLVESSSSAEELRCKVCNSPYEVEKTTKVRWERAFTTQQWLYTCVLVTCMTVAGVAAWVVIQIFESPIVRVLSAGVALLIVYVCVKFLGVNTVTAYQRAKVSGINIVSGSGAQLNTISKTVTVEMNTKSSLQMH